MYGSNCMMRSSVDDVDGAAGYAHVAAMARITIPHVQRSENECMIAITIEAFQAPIRGHEDRQLILHEPRDARPIALHAKKTRVNGRRRPNGTTNSADGLRYVTSESGIQTKKTVHLNVVRPREPTIAREPGAELRKRSVRVDRQHVGEVGNSGLDDVVPSFQPSKDDQMPGVHEARVDLKP